MQAFRQLGKLGKRELRTRGRPWHVVFEGEAAEDAGGPFRSSLMFVCDDLTSKDSGLSLMIPTRNNQFKVGKERGKFTLAPGLPLQAVDHLTFLGKLLGVGMRQQISCPLNICSTFWKHLTGEELTAKDVGLTDENSMAVIEAIHSSQDAWNTSDLTWSSHLSNGSMIELLDRSPTSTFPSAAVVIQSDQPYEDSAIPLVNERNAHTYAKRLFRSRVRESTFATALVMRGMRSVVPVDVCRLFTCEQLESEICGVASMDVDLLARNTIFEVGDAPFQKMFWDVLKSYNSREQAKFLRFVWARDRLPTKEKFEQKLRIVELRRRFAAASPDIALPEAATCSFTLTIPRYSSFAIMRRQLLIAFTNCTDYDLDGAARGFNVQAVAPLGQSSHPTHELRTSSEIMNATAINMISDVM